LLKIVLSSRIIETFQHIINQGRGFRGGSDEKMRRMWLGREVVVADLPPLPGTAISHALNLCTAVRGD